MLVIFEKLIVGACSNGLNDSMSALNIKECNHLLYTTQNHAVEIDFGLDFDDFISQMVEQAHVVNEYHLKYFNIDLVKYAQQGHQMDKCRITNDELNIVLNVLNCNGNENVSECEVETYEKVLRFEEKLLENVDESKDKEDVLNLLEKSKEVVNKINRHIELCFEIDKLYQNPEISKYVEYYNCYYTMINLFQDQLTLHGINIKKDIFVQLEGKTIDKKNILLRYFKIISETCFIAKIDKEKKKFIKKYKQYERKAKEIDEM